MFGLTGLQATLTKWGVGLAAAALISGAGYLTYKWAVHKNDTQIAEIKADAHAAGRAEAQTETVAGANQQLLVSMKNLQTMVADTQTQLSKIRTTSVVEKQTIENYNVATVVAGPHPEEVELWANQTISDAFTGIAVASTGAKQ